MRIRILLTVTLTAVVGATFATPAMAQRPAMDLDRAEHMERVVTAESVKRINADIDELTADLAALTPEEVDDSLDALAIDPKITAWTVDGCDQETRYRALCDWTVAYADGSTEDGTDEVIVKRNGRCLVRTV
jgi:hypothetical protein